ncbi:hypothetical protein [Spirulina sp. 06S082]|nr:hypothetical protein [Spirulina sp. 06S082]MEA5469508.1 hypothetical protein [Spirulina sp. 06S082]
MLFANLHVFALFFPQSLRSLSSADTEILLTQLRDRLVELP